MYVDPDIVNFYFWMHMLVLFVVTAMWLFGYGEPPREDDDNYDGDDFMRPADDDEGGRSHWL